MTEQQLNVEVGVLSRLSEITKTLVHLHHALYRLKCIGSLELHLLGLEPPRVFVDDAAMQTIREIVTVSIEKKRQEMETIYIETKKRLLK